MSAKTFEFQQAMTVVKKYCSIKCFCTNATCKNLYNMSNCWKFQIPSRTKYFSV